MSEDTRLLGEVKGKVDIILDRLEEMDRRLRVVEQRAAIVGAAGGAIVAIASQLILWMVHK